MVRIRNGTGFDLKHALGAWALVVVRGPDDSVDTQKRGYGYLLWADRLESEGQLPSNDIAK